MVTLKLFAGLRDAVGQKEVKIDQDNVTILDLLKKLGEQYNVEQYLFEENGSLFPSVLLLINDQPVSSVQDDIAEAGDVVSVLLPTAGG